MIEEVHKNYAKAAKLMLIAFAIAGVSLINNFVSIFTNDIDYRGTALETAHEQYKSSIMISIILTSFYYLGITYCIRKGYYWVKYLLSALMILNITEFVLQHIDNVMLNLESVIDIALIALKLWIIIILFKAKEAYVGADVQH